MRRRLQKSGKPLTQTQKWGLGSGTDTSPTELLLLLNVHRIMPSINCLYQNSEITRSSHICAKGWGKKVSAKITLGGLQWNTFWKISSSCTNMSTWLFFLKMCHSVIKYKVQIKWLSPHLLWRKALNPPECFNIST